MSPVSSSASRLCRFLGEPAEPRVRACVAQAGICEVDGPAADDRRGYGSSSATGMLVRNERKSRFRKVDDRAARKDAYLCAPSEPSDHF